ncbi:MAG TPA: hypothetical protein VFY93_12475 [Planctomycetota bacterium]|nr:hypothetical protein [Planctomycetota bacterium]
MRNLRNALFAVVVLGGTVALATNSGIEVLRVSGIEVLRVDTHSWGAPLGSTVHAVMDFGAGPIDVMFVPVDPLTGNATVIFPMNHPSNRVELRDPAGLLIGETPLQQWD